MEKSVGSIVETYKTKGRGFCRALQRGKACKTSRKGSHRLRGLSETAFSNARMEVFPLRSLQAWLPLCGRTAVVIHKVGQIFSYFPTRNFGWIKQEDGTAIFFHSDNVWDVPPEEIEIGQTVIFLSAVGKTSGKPFARNIQIVSPELLESIGTDTRLYGYVCTSPSDNNGVGFLNPTYSKARLFFHINSVVNREDLETGQLVSFRIAELTKGLAAFEVSSVPEVQAEAPNEVSTSV
jgi:cold shock CspA family protein